MKKIKIKQNTLRTFPVFLLPLLLCLPVYLLYSYTNVISYFQMYARTTMIVICIIYGILIFLMIQKKASETPIVSMLIVGGLLLRTFYIFLTPYNVSPHDIGWLAAWNNNDIGKGHLGYMQYIYKFGQLPDFDPRKIWAFYNPPLHYILEALWIKINRFFGLPWSICADNIRILILLYTTACVTVIYSILKKFDIKGKALLIIMAIISFHPIFISMAASCGNDSLALLFALLAVDYTIRWYQDSSVKHIVMLAVFIAAGILTKASAGFVAIPVAFVFLYTLIKRRDNWKKYFAQFFLFGCICIPLGLFWMVRCYLLFGMPFTYVPDIGPGSGQYIGNYSLLQRFGLPAWKLLFYPTSDLNIKMSYNVWLQTFKTSLFDEASIIQFSGIGTTIAIILLWVTILLVLILNGYLIAGLLSRNKMSVVWKVFFGLSYFLLIASFVKFNIRYPYICTTHFRYIANALLYVSVLSGVYLAENEKGKYTKRILNLSILLTIVFVVLTTVLYVMYLSAL